MKLYNKETRNEEGKFYRNGDWGVEPIRDMSAYKNFTELVPPAETLEHGVPCDWIGESWVLDKESEEYKNLYQIYRAEAYPPLEEQLDFIFHNGIESWKTDIIQPVKDKYPKG